MPDIRAGPSSIFFHVAGQFGAVDNDAALLMLPSQAWFDAAECMGSTCPDPPDGPQIRCASPGAFDVKG